MGRLMLVEPEAGAGFVAEDTHFDIFDAVEHLEKRGDVLALHRGVDHGGADGDGRGHLFCHGGVVVDFRKSLSE